MNKQITRGDSSIVPQNKRRKTSPGAAIKSSGQDIDAALEELNGIEDDLGFSARWAELQEQFPDHLQLWSARVSWLIRGKHFEDAVECISQREIHDFDEDALALKA